LKILAAEFPADMPAVLTTTQRVSTRDWCADLERPSSGAQHPMPQDAAEFHQPTRYVPTGGIVKETADKITNGAVTDVEKARAIYEWIVENTYRNPKVRGCGRGDIRPTLETGDLGGKRADLNSLFVGLVKASGIPARDGRSPEISALPSDVESVPPSHTCAMLYPSIVREGLSGQCRQRAPRLL